MHTSDWHLGATLDGLSREEDHEHFLRWLAATLEAREVDVLVVDGDIFDQAQPAAEAQRRYFRLLHRIAGQTVRKVVVIGGNHDSPSRLDGPQELLASRQVHVVAGLQAARSTWDRCLCPVPGPNSKPRCVVVAVPLVHEFRLGVRTTLLLDEEIRLSVTEAFRGLYRELADRAEAMAGEAPLIATGPLAVDGAERGDAPADVPMIRCSLPDDSRPSVLRAKRLNVRRTCRRRRAR